MDQKDGNDDYREFYRARWNGKQVEFMEKYGNGNSTSGTLNKWLSKKTLRSASAICKAAVKRFMADLERMENIISHQIWQDNW